MKQKDEMIIRKFRDNEGRAVSNIIRDNLAQIISKNHPGADMDSILEKYTPGYIIALSKKRKMYVALIDDVVVGTVSIDGNTIYTVFADIQCHGKGIAEKLVGLMEEIAANSGYASVKTTAIIGMHEFYEKLGYKAIEEVESEGFGKNTVMEKRIF